MVEGVSGRFAAQAGQLLENLRQTESALKRLKKNRPEAASEAGQLSDIEKISLQLYLDVQVQLSPCRHINRICKSRMTGTNTVGMHLFSSALGFASF